MKFTRNNHVFKGHKALLGSKFVTYGEVELPSRYDLHKKSKHGFDWGYVNEGSEQLAFSMLYQLSNEEFARENALKYVEDVIKTFTTRDWLLNASDVLEWIDNNSTEEEAQQSVLDQEDREIKINRLVASKKKNKKHKTNIVKDICKEIGITQKNLAEILEVPEGTVSSWAVKNEIPRLGKKAIEFYILNKKKKINLRN